MQGESDMDFDGWVIPVATLLLGQLSLFALEWLRHGLSRKQRRDDARDDFQRQTLLDLQEAVYWLVRLLGNAKIEFEREKQALGRYDWPPEESPYIAGGVRIARITWLSERVNDEDVRRLVTEFFDEYDKLLRPSSKFLEEPAFEARLDALWDMQKRANKRMGTVLRSL